MYPNEEFSLLHADSGL